MPMVFGAQDTRSATIFTPILGSTSFFRPSISSQSPGSRSSLRSRDSSTVFHCAGNGSVFSGSVLPVRRSVSSFVALFAGSFASLAGIGVAVVTVTKKLREGRFTSMQPFALTLVNGVAPSVSRMLLTLLSNESQLYAVVKPTYEYLISTGFHTDCTGCGLSAGEAAYAACDSTAASTHAPPSRTRAWDNSFVSMTRLRWGDAGLGR